MTLSNVDKPDTSGPVKTIKIYGHRKFRPEESLTVRIRRVNVRRSPTFITSPVAKCTLGTMTIALTVILKLLSFQHYFI